MKELIEKIESLLKNSEIESITIECSEEMKEDFAKETSCKLLRLGGQLIITYQSSGKLVFLK